MSPLFHRSEKKGADQAALQAELERLRTLSAEDMALLLLPGMQPDGPRTSLRVQQLCSYLVRDFPGAGQQKPLVLMSYVNEALGKLEQAGLVSSLHLQRAPVWRITHLGEASLAAGTVEAKLSQVE
jgi:hypothetical protein